MTDPILSALADYDATFNIGLAVVVMCVILGVSALLWSAVGRRGFD